MSICGLWGIAMIEISDIWSLHNNWKVSKVEICNSKRRREQEGALSHMAAVSKADRSSSGFMK